MSSSTNLSSAELNGGQVVFQTSQGLAAQGRILRLTRYNVVFQTASPHDILKTSESLSELEVVLNGKTLYSGAAVVSSLISAGTLVTCEATFAQPWNALDLSADLGTNGRLEKESAEFISRWQKFYRVHPEYRMVVGDIQTLLVELQLWVDQLELSVRSTPSGERSGVEQEVVRSLAPTIIPYLDKLFDDFERVSNALEPELRAAHRAYARRQLHALVLSSPFAFRTFHKPLGYAGDYEMVNMIHREAGEGATLFAKLMNLWFVRQAPAVAHRNRIEHLVVRLNEEAVRLYGLGRPLRILNMGCGPALEIQRFLADSELSNRAEFTLFDFNDETLQHVRTTLEEAARKHGRSTSFRLVKKSVAQVLKEVGRSMERGHEFNYDFVYCAGLFDYLSDQVCRGLLDVFFNRLSPNGLLLATNVHESNPRRETMESLLEWSLIYRDRSTLESLRPLSAAAADFSVRADLTGVNNYIEIRNLG
jgi:extracellular factor (EF) 3-hydroxypalmitic acid methyl ester biosynthesis protein